MRVLYFSTVNWRWIKQRPHFLAEYLSSRSIQVDYFSLTPFRKQKIEKNNHSTCLRIRDTYVIPFASKLKWIEQINISYVKAILSNTHYDKIILTHPMQYKYLSQKQKNNAEIIYDCMDNIPYFYHGSKQAKLIKEEKQLCHMVQKIIVSSNYLKEKLMTEYNVDSNKVSVILNAVDKREFTLKVNPVELKKPNLVYIGSINEWVDIETLKAFAKDNSSYYIYLIGPIEGSVKKQVDHLSDNCIWIDSIPHSKVKDYIVASDILLIPFKVNELIKGVDPVKMYEYLSMGGKVLTSYWEELDKYKNNDSVYFYGNPKEFEEKVYSIINKQKSSVRNTSFLDTNNWEIRVEEYIKVLNG